MSSFQERISLLDAELNGGPAGLEGGSGHQRLTAQLEDSYRAVSKEWDYLMEWRKMGEQIRQSSQDPAELNELMHEHAEVGRGLLDDVEAATMKHLDNMESLFHSGLERLAGAEPGRIQNWDSAWHHELDEFHEEVRLMRNTALLPYPAPPQAQPQPQQHASQAHAPQQPTPAVVASAAHSAVASSARTSRPRTPNPTSGAACSHSASPPSPRPASPSRPVSPQPGPSGPGPKPAGRR